MPQRANRTSFSKDYQPAPQNRSSGPAHAAAARAGRVKKTQAQEALVKAGHNPMEQLIGMANMYQKMLMDKITWSGQEATDKELDAYAKELTKINETLASYQSSKAPVEKTVFEETQPEDLPSAAVDDTAPLTPKELIQSRNKMIEDLKDRL